MKLKLISGCLAIALMQIAPSNAQSVSPAGHYTYNRRGQLGEMRVQKVGAEWRIFVIAAGAPRGPATAADCGLLAVGAIEGKTFQGEIKYIFDNTDSNAALDYLKGGNSKPNDIDVEAGHKITITFAPQSASYEMIRVTLVQPAALSTTASSAASRSAESDSWALADLRGHPVARPGKPFRCHPPKVWDSNW